MRKSKRLFLILVMIGLMLNGCTSVEAKQGAASANKPALPERLELNQDGVPVLQVYDVDAGQTVDMDIENYVMGVVAGEMKNNWPMEALKAQAILARTFVLKFCDTKHSRYENADISTDIEEAQAYAPLKINARIQRAVEETRGLVLNAEGEYPYAWFHAHSGGTTELPSAALDFKDNDPEYLSVVKSPDSEKAPEDVKNWTASFDEDEIISGCKKLNIDIETVESIDIGKKGASGRAATFVINGKELSAPSFRIAIGANKLKSTLITEILHSENTVTFKGSGYGHGVGMSQWGAYALAEDGKTAEEIIKHYFKDIRITDMW